MVGRAVVVVVVVVAGGVVLGGEVPLKVFTQHSLDRVFAPSGVVVNSLKFIASAVI